MAVWNANKCVKASQMSLNLSYFVVFMTVTTVTFVYYYPVRLSKNLLKELFT